MAYREDEEKRIYELETAESLSAGTFVPVDKEGNEMAEKFDLGTALDEKVDVPSTAPEAGQVLTFDGTENSWANPPEGVYVINYSEVTDLDDIDTEKATTIPTFMKIDNEDIQVTVPVGEGTSNFTQYCRKGTVLKLDEVGPLVTDSSSPYYNKPQYFTFCTNVGSYAGGTFGQPADVKFKIIVSSSRISGVTKLCRIMGELDDNGGLFQTQPQPFTKRYINWRGPGSPFNSDSNSLCVEFQQNGQIRRQLLPSLDLATYTFNSSQGEAPQIIYSMGWGSARSKEGTFQLLGGSSNVGGNNTYPYQTPKVDFTDVVMGDPTSNFDPDQKYLLIEPTYQNSDCSSNLSPRYFAIPDNGFPSGESFLKYWGDSKGGHIDWKPVNEVPTSTSSDEGKVLTVDSNGAPVWGQSGPFASKEYVDGIVGEVETQLSEL